MRCPLVHTGQVSALLKHVLVNHPIMFYPVTLNLLFKLDTGVSIPQRYGPMSSREMGRGIAYRPGNLRS